MATKYKATEIRWIRRKRSSLRRTIVYTVINAIVTGFFLGITWLQYLRGRGDLNVLTPLVLAFCGALTTLRGTFDALRDCPRPTKTAGGEDTFHNASAEYH